MTTTPNEFWLTLHQLSEAFRDEGLTTDERLASISDEFLALPWQARRQVLIDLAFAVRHLPDLYEAITPHAMRGEEQDRTNQAAG